VPARAWALGIAVLLSGCVSRTVRQDTATGAASGTPDDVQALVRLALTLDAAGDRGADTLYASDALVIGNARVRLAGPRFAGMTGNRAANNRVTVTAATVTVGGRFAWVLMDYQWFNATDRRGETGRATVICERRAGTWKIVHAHSSQPLPWETGP
jgi:ketosteroid isomerase-like protein